MCISVGFCSGSTLREQRMAGYRCKLHIHRGAAVKGVAYFAIYLSTRTYIPAVPSVRYKEAMARTVFVGFSLENLMPGSVRSRGRRTSFVR